MRIFIFIALLFPVVLFGQDLKDSIHFSGYTEIYFSQDQHNWTDHQRPAIFYSHTSTNHVALNTAVIDFKYSSERLKTQLSLVEGTYSNKVTSAEPIGFGALYVANISYKLSKSKEFWLQAGVFPSHIGIESAIGFSNLSLSRSLAAENSPYYESGVSLQFTSKNKKWYTSILLLNGWQTMTLSSEQNQGNFGTQIQYKPTAKLSLNHSTYLGSVVVSDSSQQRFYQNFYADVLLKDKWNLQLQADYGLQKTTGDAFNSDWFTGFIGMAYSLNDKIKLVGRGELLGDPSNLVIVGENSSLVGYSFNINYKLHAHLLFRAEWRNITSRTSTFAFEQTNDKRMNGINLSLAAQF